MPHRIRPWWTPCNDWPPVVRSNCCAIRAIAASPRRSIPVWPPVPGTMWSCSMPIPWSTATGWRDCVAPPMPAHRPARSRPGAVMGRWSAILCKAPRRRRCVARRSMPSWHTNVPARRRRYRSVWVFVCTCATTVGRRWGSLPTRYSGAATARKPITVCAHGQRAFTPCSPRMSTSNIWAGAPLAPTGKRCGCAHNAWCNCATPATQKRSRVTASAIRYTPCGGAWMPRACAPAPRRRS